MLKEGDKAPPFNLPTDDGGKVSLKDFADKALVLYFYPRDNTPGCTRQAQAFTAARKKIEAAGGAVVGVSKDTPKSHQSFRTKCDLDITLASDTDLAVHKAYGAWGEKTMYGKKIEGTLRTTFVIRDGKIAKVFPSVKVDGHADAVLDALRGGPSKATPEVAKRATASKKAAAPAGAAVRAPGKKAAERPPRKGT